MPESQPSQTLEQLLEDSIFADPDPRVQQVRRDWEEVKAKAEQVFRWNDDENLAECLRHHFACGTPDAEAVALAESAVLRQLLIEARDTRLAAIWNESLTQVRAIMEENKRGE